MFSNNDINKFILLLREGNYPYKYMDDWKKFNETTLLEQKKFYRNLSMEDITNADCMHGKKICENLEKKDLGEYHDLQLRSDVLPLAKVFQNFRKMCIRIYELDHVKFSQLRD